MRCTRLRTAARRWKQHGDCARSCPGGRHDAASRRVRPVASDSRRFSARRHASDPGVGAGGEESRVEGLEADADDYLVKPFAARELLARVAAHVKMAELAAKLRNAKKGCAARRNSNARSCAPAKSGWRRQAVSMVLQRSEAFLVQGQKISHTGSFGRNVLSEKLYWSEETTKSMSSIDPLSQRWGG